MKRKILLSVLMCTMMVAAGIASEKEMEPYKPGDKIQPFTLKDAHGNEHDLSEYLGKKVIVLDFWNMNCPVSKGYEERLKALCKKYGKPAGSESAKAGSKSAQKDDAKVVFFAIDSNKTNDIDGIKEYAKKHKLPYPVLKDWENKIADKFGAKVTPEVFIIGKDKKIHYHGAIDNSLKLEEVEHHFADDAIQAILKGNEPKVKEHKAFGCSIKRISE